MSPIRIDNDAPLRGQVSAEPFDWDAWLVPGQRVQFRKDKDFPGSSMTTFRQSLRNAAGRRGYTGKYRTLRIDDDSFELIWKE
jgi:hypothetical protein